MNSCYHRSEVLTIIEEIAILLQLNIFNLVGFHLLSYGNYFSEVVESMRIIYLRWIYISKRQDYRDPVFKCFMPFFWMISMIYLLA